MARPMLSGAAIRSCVSLLLAAAIVIGVWASPVRGDENDPIEASEPAAEEAGETAEDEANGGRTKKKSFPVIPIPIFITEPAIGYGLGAAVGYFHPRRGGDEDDDSIPPAITIGTSPASGRGKESKRPPTITGIAAAYTDKETWAVGLGHSASWAGDRIRYAGFVAYANLNSTFYLLDLPFAFNLEGGVLYQNIRFRLGSSDFFLGGKLSYLNADGTFKLGEEAPVDLLERNMADSGLGLQAVWDTRDNTMTPDAGQYFEAVLWRYDEAIGGEFDYWKADLKLLSFHTFAKRFVLGFRLDLDTVDGNPPLWAFPWISLRGIPALRYQNETAGAIETELRWNIFPRWAVLGFVGVGASRGDTLVYEDESGIIAAGVGGRWLFRPEDSLWVGVDVARGPEDTYAYIQVGHAW
ncbi:MAG: BamA/TamA family outer membrane protein [Candidatus Sulfomarinibacteraceae bacterium]